jgi:hypothetical protein
LYAGGVAPYQADPLLTRSVAILRAHKRQRPTFSFFCSNGWLVKEERNAVAASESLYKEIIAHYQSKLDRKSFERLPPEEKEKIVRSRIINERFAEN